MPKDNHDNFIVGSMSGSFYSAGGQSNAWGAVSWSDVRTPLLIGFDASRNWTGETSSNGNHSHKVTASGSNGNTGGGGSHKKISSNFHIFVIILLSIKEIYTYEYINSR